MAILVDDSAEKITSVYNEAFDLSRFASLMLSSHGVAPASNEKLGADWSTACTHATPGAKWV